MEYQVTVTETYWVQAETPEQAKSMVRFGNAGHPDTVDVEVN